MKEKKIYRFKYDENTKNWDPLEVTAQVVNGANNKPTKLIPDVSVVDSESGGSYPAIKNNILLVENTKVLSESEDSDVAKIDLRLNDQDARLKEIIKKDSRFMIKVTLYPKIEQKNGGGASKSEPLKVEGITQIYVELPQKWELTLRKAFWHSEQVIDLKKQEGINQDQLQELGDWGGKLILKPKGMFKPSEKVGGEKIISNYEIAHAAQCTLDRGDGKIIKGVWNEWDNAYVFEIEPSQENSRGVSEVELRGECYAEMLPGYAAYFDKLLYYAKSLQGSLGTGVMEKAREYTRGYLDRIAEDTEENLVSDREEIRSLVINTPTFLYGLKYSTMWFDRAMDLFGEGFARFYDNLVNGIVEFIFWCFGFLFDYIKGKVIGKDALDSASKQGFKNVAREGAEDLATKKDVFESSLTQLRRQSESLNQQFDNAFERVVRGNLDESTAALDEMNSLLPRLRNLDDQIADTTRQLGDLNAGVRVLRHIEDNIDKIPSGEIMDELEKAAKQMGDTVPELRVLRDQMDTLQNMRLGEISRWEAALRSQAANSNNPQTQAYVEDTLQKLAHYREQVRLEMVYKFDESEVQNQLLKSTFGNKIKEVNQAVEKMKKDYDERRYRSTPRSFYDPGVMGWIWHKVDVLMEWLSWIYDNVVEVLQATGSWIAQLANDYVLGYINDFINWMLEIVNNHLRTVTWINSLHYSSGVANVKGVAGDKFFNFPQILAETIENSKPNKVVDMAGGSGSMEARNRVKAQIKNGAKNGFEAEKNSQKQSAYKFFNHLIDEGLHPMRFKLGGPGENVRTEQVKAEYDKLRGVIEAYERSFVQSSQVGFAYFYEVPHSVVTNFTYHDLDAAIEWLAWAISWLVRLGSLLLVFTGWGAMAIPLAWGYAEIFERVVAGVRPMISWVGTMPTVVGLAFDTVILAGLIYDMTIVGTVSADQILVDA